jgi:hypothetical protein
MQAFSAAGQEMYQNQAQESQASAGTAQEEPQQPAGGSPDEEVVEADYEIVDEEK